MNKLYMKKYLAVAVILLFIGVAFAPSIHANISKEMVEFTTEVCGLAGEKHTVKLTRAEAEEVEALFDSIRERLNDTETREEAEEIFKEAVVELDKYGLLGGLSVRQAQRLVIGRYQDSRVMKILEKLYGRSQWLIDGNLLCLTVGKTSNTAVFSIPERLMLKIIYGPELLFGNGNYFILKLALLGCLVLSVIISSLSPLKLLSTITFGDYSFGWYTPARGWVLTIGLLGVRICSGAIRGDISQIPSWWGSILYVGAIGFTGIRLYGFVNTFFLGSSLWANVY